MIELDRKLLDLFQGFVVRKDIVRAVKVGANVPVFVLEYLLAYSCSTVSTGWLMLQLRMMEAFADFSPLLPARENDPLSI